MPDHQSAVYCKSFSDDFDRLKNLIDSFSINNPEEIPMLLSVPEKDLSLLAEKIALPAFITLIADEQYTDTERTFQYGWMQQQVCKLSVHKTGFAKSYLMLDSDTYVIAPVTHSLFYTDGTPNIVYSEVFTKYTPCNERLRTYIMSDEAMGGMPLGAGTRDGFSQRLLEIRQHLAQEPSMPPDRRGQFINKLFNCKNSATQPGQIFHADILIQLDTFLEQNSMNFYDAIDISPWEYNWYGHFCTTLNEKVYGITSPIVHFASDAAIDDAKHHGITFEMLKKKFVSVQMAARHFETTAF